MNRVWLVVADDPADTACISPLVEHFTVYFLPRLCILYVSRTRQMMCVRISVGAIVKLTHGDTSLQ